MAAGIAMGVAQILPAARVGVNLNRESAKWSFFGQSASSSYSSSSSAVPRTLILYSKPGCCLCEGLKEKLDAAFALSGPNSLHDVQLQIRDITSNPDWERLYQYEIPVLARIHDDGTEKVDWAKVKQQSNIDTGLPCLELSNVGSRIYNWRVT